MVVETAGVTEVGSKPAGEERREGILGAREHGKGGSGAVEAERDVGLQGRIESDTTVGDRERGKTGVSDRDRDRPRDAAMVRRLDA